ncbi:unnamed protein product [Dovyalis caffra]|uniref:Uncharacterized protein n=1 Tax=Dovyalis caffra TaxID=77055 RepID=A0AAV1RZL0_9ROSI|nr:unnamed protein product [Dovyalis caffra]
MSNRPHFKRKAASSLQIPRAVDWIKGPKKFQNGKRVERESKEESDTALTHPLIGGVVAGPSGSRDPKYGWTQNK